MAANSIVDVHALAQFWDVDARTIQNYADATYENPPLPRVERGKYDFIQAMKWMYNRQKRKLEIAESSGDETLHAARLEGQMIKNKKEEMALKRELAKTLDKKSTLIAFSNQMGVIANALESLKFDLTRDLEEETEQIQKQLIIETSIENIKEVIINMDIKPYLKSEDALEDLITHDDGAE